MFQPRDPQEPRELSSLKTALWFWADKLALLLPATVHLRPAPSEQHTRRKDSLPPVLEAHRAAATARGLCGLSPPPQAVHGLSGHNTLVPNTITPPSGRVHASNLFSKSSLNIQESSKIEPKILRLKGPYLA